METVENTTFRNNVTVDNTVFRGCNFYGAQMVYAGGELPSFEDCRFDSNVTLSFEGSAANTLAFFTELQLSGFAPAVDNILAAIRSGSA